MTTSAKNKKEAPVALCIAALGCVLVAFTVNVVASAAIRPHPAPIVKRTPVPLPLRRSLTRDERRASFETTFVRTLDVDGHFSNFVCAKQKCDAVATALVAGRASVNGDSIARLLSLYGYDFAGDDADARLRHFQGIGDILTSRDKVRALTSPNLGATALAGLAACRLGAVVDSDAKYAQMCLDLAAFFKNRVCLVDSVFLGFVDPVSNKTHTKDAALVYAFASFGAREHPETFATLRDEAAKSFSQPYVSKTRACEPGSVEEEARTAPTEEIALLRLAQFQGVDGASVAGEKMDAFTPTGCADEANGADPRASTGVECANVHPRLLVRGFRAHVDGPLDLRATTWARLAGVVESEELRDSMASAYLRFPAGLPRFSHESNPDPVAAAARLFETGDEALMGTNATSTGVVSTDGVFSCRAYEAAEAFAGDEDECGLALASEEDLELCLAQNPRFRAFLGSEASTRESLRRTCNETLGSGVGVGGWARCRTRGAVLRVLRDMRVTCAAVRATVPPPPSPPSPPSPPPPRPPPLSPPPTPSSPPSPSSPPASSPSFPASPSPPPLPPAAVYRAYAQLLRPDPFNFSGIGYKDDKGVDLPDYSYTRVTDGSVLESGSIIHPVLVTDAPATHYFASASYYRLFDVSYHGLNPKPGEKYGDCLPDRRLQYDFSPSVILCALATDALVDYFSNYPYLPFGKSCAMYTGSECSSVLNVGPYNLTMFESNVLVAAPPFSPPTPSPPSPPPPYPPLASETRRLYMILEDPVRVEDVKFLYNGTSLDGFVFHRLDSYDSPVSFPVDADPDAVVRYDFIQQSQPDLRPVLDVTHANGDFPANFSCEEDSSRFAMDISVVLNVTYDSSVYYLCELKEGWQSCIVYLSGTCMMSAGQPQPPPSPPSPPSPPPVPAPPPPPPLAPLMYSRYRAFSSEFSAPFSVDEIGFYNKTSKSYFSGYRFWTVGNESLSLPATLTPVPYETSLGLFKKQYALFDVTHESPGERFLCDMDDIQGFFLAIKYQGSTVTSIGLYLCNVADIEGSSCAVMYPHIEMCGYNTVLNS